MVLQPAAETETYEVCGAALTGGRRRGSAVPGCRVRLLNRTTTAATRRRHAHLHTPADQHTLTHIVTHKNTDTRTHTNRSHPDLIYSLPKSCKLVVSVDIITTSVSVCLSDSSYMFRDTGYIINDYIHIMTVSSGRFIHRSVSARLSMFSEHRNVHV